MRISGSNLGLVAILPIISTLTHTLLAITLLNADHAQNYVDSIIQQFEEDSQRFSCCSFIYPPLPPLGSPKEAYFLPKLLIWSPQDNLELPSSVQNMETNFDHISGQVTFLEREVKWPGLFMI